MPVNKSPNTGTNANIDARLNVLRNKYNLIQKNAVYDFERVTDDTFIIIPARQGVDVQNIVLPFRIQDVKAPPTIEVSDTWTMDMTASDIDLETFTGGRIDGIAKENERLYLYWAFLDENFEFAGFGITRKPYSPFTGSSGTANKGTTINITGMVTAFQFTVGARVALTNRIGTEPIYQWNWATINSIVSDTSVNVTMDDNAEYGFNLTGSTSGRMIQWDKFRPFVPTTSTQPLFQPNYLLLGEIYLEQTGDIWRVYRKEAEFRFLPLPIHETAKVFPVAFSSGGPVGDNEISLARKIPLWAEHFWARLSISGISAGNLLRIHGGSNSSGLFATNSLVRLQVDNRTDDTEVIRFPTRRHAILSWNATNTGGKTIQILGWYITGGMRK